MDTTGSFELIIVEPVVYGYFHIDFGIITDLAKLVKSKNTRGIMQ